MAWWCDGVLRISSTGPGSASCWSVSRRRWWWLSDNRIGRRCIVWWTAEPPDGRLSWWGLLRPTWTHSPPPPRCTLSRQKVGKVPWSLSPKGRRFPPQASAASASHLAWRCWSPLDIVGIPCRNGGCPWRWMASRSRSVGSYPRSFVPRSVRRTSMSDTSLVCLPAPPLVRIVRWSGRILGGTKVVLPRNSTWARGRTYLFDVGSSAPGSIQSRWSWRCAHTRGCDSRWRGDAHREMCIRCPLLLRCGDPISGPPPSFRCPLTRRDREVVDFTRSRVKNNTELTNLGN